MMDHVWRKSMTWTTSLAVMLAAAAAAPGSERPDDLENYLALAN